MPQLFLILLLSSYLVNAGNVYVSLSGSDFPGCGSQAQPCLDVFYAVANEAGPNDTVLVGPGDYAVSPSSSVSIAMNLTFAPSLPQEGPPTFNFREMCPDSSVFQISSTASSPVSVSFTSFQFENLNCASTGPSILSLSSDANSMLSVSLSHTNFLYNYYQNKTGGSIISVPGSAGEIQLSIDQSEFGLNTATVANVSAGISSVTITKSYFQQNTGIAIAAGLDQTQTSSSKILIENSSITQNQIGIAVGVEYQVTVDSSTISSNTQTDVDCEGANITIENSDVGTFTCYSVGDTQCLINSKAGCYY